MKEYKYTCIIKLHILCCIFCKFAYFRYFAFAYMDVFWAHSVLQLCAKKTSSKLSVLILCKRFGSNWRYYLFSLISAGHLQQRRFFFVGVSFCKMQEPFLPTTGSSLPLRKLSGISKPEFPFANMHLLITQQSAKKRANLVPAAVANNAK